MLTADTLTEEQILDVLADAQDREWWLVAADCYTAMHGVRVQRATRRRRPVYCKVHPGYRAARARIAELLNARAKEAE